MEVISLKGPHRIVRFPRGDGEGDGYWYRSETLLRGLSLGSTYDTLAEAEHDFIHTILADGKKKGGVTMPRLKPGALIIDLADGSIHGDVEHCPKEDLLESARALLSILPQVRHKGLWGLGKAYNADCYIHTTQTRYQVPDVSLEVGWATDRTFHLVTIHGNREAYWKGDWYSKPVGAVKDGEVVDNTEGIPDHFIPQPAATTPTPQGKMHTAKPRSQVARPRLF